MASITYMYVRQNVFSDYSAPTGWQAYNEGGSIESFVGARPYTNPYQCFATILRINSDVALSSITINWPCNYPGTTGSTVTCNFKVCDSLSAANSTLAALPPWGGSGGRQGSFSLTWSSGETSPAVIKASIPVGDSFIVFWDNNTGAYYASSSAPYVSSATKQTYSVYYNSNNHGTAPDTQIKTAGVGLTLQPFIGNDVVDSDSATTAASISFAAGAGSGSKAALSSAGTKHTTTEYTQTSWKDSTGATYGSRGNYTRDSGTTMTAQWSSSSTSYNTYAEVSLPDSSGFTKADAPLGKYKLTFEEQKGEDVEDLEVDRLAVYRFANWADGAGNLYSPGQKYAPPGSVTLTAQWEVYGYYANAIRLPTPERRGYEFLGWAESPDAESGAIGEYSPTKDVTLYAIWKLKDYARVFDGTEWMPLIPMAYNGSGWEVIQSNIGGLQ